MMESVADRPDTLTAELEALTAAGVSAREAASHLVIATRLLEGLDLDCRWLRATYQLLADLAHELDPNHTPYPRNV